MYPEELGATLDSEIIEPIELHLLYHETPAEWIIEFEKEYDKDDFVDYYKKLKDLGVKK
jgi:hypothetical protein